MFDGDPNFKKLGQKFAPTAKKSRPYKHQNLGQIRTTSQLDREYIRNETRYRRTENGVANGNLSCAFVLNLLNFGPQTVKNKTGVSTDPTCSRCMGHVSM